MDKVQIVRSMRRTLVIQVMPDASVKVFAPHFYPSFKINKFLQEKESWIKTRQQMIRSRRLQKEQGEYLYLGKTYPLELRLQQKNIVEVEDKIYIASSNKKYVQTHLTTWYKQEARKIIVQRVQYYAKKAGLEYKRISITSAETRWGSCSSEKTLNFNWRLIMAPLEVIDYVVAHELAHLTELNHSKAFWESVRKMYPLYREYRTWLKRHGETLRV